MESNLWPITTYQLDHGAESTSSLVRFHFAIFRVWEVFPISLGISWETYDLLYAWYIAGLMLFDKLLILWGAGSSDSVVWYGTGFGEVKQEFLPFLHPSQLCALFLQKQQLLLQACSSQLVKHFLNYHLFILQ